MATSYSSTPETTNANRASRILLGPCTDQLRDVLRQRVPPANFHHVITRNRSSLPRLTQPQRDLIFPRSGRYSGDYSDMDISLLNLLLRNICNIPPHTKGWGNTPDISDSSLSASIDRIRDARNGAVHSSSTNITQTEFNHLLHEIKIAVISMDSYLGNSNKYEKAVDFLLTETMDPEQDVFIQQLRKEIEEDETTKEGLVKLEKRVHGVEKLDRRVETLERGEERRYKIIQKNKSDIEDIRRQVIENKSVKGKGAEEKDNGVKKSFWGSLFQKLRWKKKKPELEVICFLKTQIERKNVDIDHQYIQTIALECLALILDDYDPICARGNVCVTEFHENYRLMQKYTFKLVERHKTLFHEIEERGIQLGRSYALNFLKIFAEKFVKGKFKEFCEQDADFLFVSLIEYAKDVKDLLAGFDGNTERLKNGSVIWCIVFNTVVGLDRFWKYFLHGELQRFLEDLMNKKELQFLLGAKKICIAVDISKEGYLLYRQYLDERANAEIKDLTRRTGKDTENNKREIDQNYDIPSSETKLGEIEKRKYDRNIVFHRRASSESYFVLKKRRNIFHNFPFRRTQSEPSLLETRDKPENVLRQTMQESELFQKEEIEDTGTISQQLLKEMDPLRYQRQDNKHATKDESNVVRLQTTYESSTFLKQQTSTEKVFLSQQSTSEFDIVPQPRTDESDNLQNIIDEMDNIQLSGDESEITLSNLPGNESKNTSSHFSEHERVDTSSHQMDTKDVIFQGPTPKGSKNATSKKRISRHASTPSDAKKTFQSEKFPEESSSKYFTETVGSETETAEKMKRVAKTEWTAEAVERLETGIKWNISEDVVDVEPDVNILREKLIERNNEETREIPLSDVTTDGDTLPIEHLFASVVIREDVKENRKGKKSAQSEESQEGKTVKSPEDMLTKNGKPVPRVFMLGKAAHGKTTYCKWFLKTWCNTKQPGMIGPLNKWENALSQFDFVFHIPLRHVDPSRADVIEMICQDILGSDTDLQATAKRVLSSEEYRCFIMMDGLDEWKPDQSVIDRLKYKGMPNIDNMSNCVIFTTMRPWKFSEIQGVKNEDRVIEILGLDDTGIESVIEKVLVHYYEMKPGTVEFQAKCKEIKSKLKDETVKSFIKIPLLAVVCVQIWYDGEQVGDSITSFYIAMVNMLIKRAHLNHDTQKLIFESINVSLPKLMSAKKNIKIYSNVLLKLGKVAYEGLLSKEMKLVFQKDDLETEIGERELQFALDVGLISQRDVHSVMEEKVSVHFFHKSVQEFLAAIYIVTNKEVSDLFCKHLCDIKVIMELSNVIMFICGMCPCLGSVISQRVVSVTDSDTEICEYRESPRQLSSDTVKELYKLQVSWLRELEYGQTDSPVTDSPVTFHVSDVYVGYNSDIETVRVTREILSDHRVDIRLLYLYLVPIDGERGISNIVVNNLLSDPHRTRSLTKVYIYGGRADRTINKVCGPSLRALDLNCVKVANTNTVPGPVLCQCDRLKWLGLYKVTLGDRDLGLTPSMTLLQKVRLDTVNMTSSGWGRWLQSVIDIHHQFDVILRDTNTDRHTRSTIHSSPHLSVTRDDGGWLNFTRVWPLTQDTQ